MRIFVGIKAMELGSLFKNNFSDQNSPKPSNAAVTSPAEDSWHVSCMALGNFQQGLPLLRVLKKWVFHWDSYMNQIWELLSLLFY